MHGALRAPRRAARQTAYWLIATRDDTGAPAFMLSESMKALPVFSFREEAELYLRLRGLEDHWRIRRIFPAELLSLLDGPLLEDLGRVVLDPIPEILHPTASGLLLSMRREEFAARLEASLVDHLESV